MTYSGDRIQDLIDEWWVKDEEPGFSAGKLIWAYMPYVDMIPYILIPEGRTGDSTQHHLANFRIEQLRISTTYNRTDDLPVAGLPINKGEIRKVSRAKKRPAVILASNGNDLGKKISTGMPTWQKGSTVIAAPFYGVDRSGTRGGFREDFVKKIYEGEYPQFMMDSLPFTGTNESVLYFNHMQALGKHHETIERTGFRLSDDALEILNQWVSWFMSGGVEEDTALALFKDLNENLFPN